ncbi:arabinose efflux permease family protein [Desulfosporosinus acidiphilus SJ4]|uniref:Arabinose efflux permease family protein n=1 Tax=Desulfosporosinus acidiphilus (strain DSM 22704 / JCM 16185 / SJ4) TaxID=646529 RepID=I4DB62_DESAJ|nr:MFS transporter [Desulfosporosinus acidiphilus]AFM43036.1 arabinose efflux permease family protein [Desulfosporosinus acidiphilus SJ4]
MNLINSSRADGIGLTRKQKIALFFSTLFVFANIYSPQPILPSLTQVYHQPPQTVSLIISLPLILIALFSLLYGCVSDRYGRWTVMRWSTVGLIIPTLLLTIAPNFRVLLLLRALQGLLLPGYMTTVISYVNDIFLPTERGAGMGIFAAASAIAGPLGRIEIGTFSQFLDWKAGFFSAAFDTLIAWILIDRILPNELNPAANLSLAVSDSAPKENFKNTLNSFYDHLRNRHLLGAYLVGAAMHASFISVLTYLPFRLSKAPYCLNPSQISLIYVLYLLGAVAAPRAGRLSDSIGRRFVLALALSLMLIGLWITISSSLILILTGITLTILGLFSVQSTATSLIGDWAKKNRGTATSLYTFFYYIGAGIGTSVNAIIWIQASWTGIIIVCIFSLLIALLSVAFLC